MRAEPNQALKAAGNKRQRTLAHSTFSLLRLRSPHSVLHAHVQVVCTPSWKARQVSVTMDDHTMTQAAHPSSALMASSPSRLSYM